MMKYKYLFGPVPSRRLGISLGIDLVPHKTCTLNCIYCQCGETTNLNIKRKEYVPTNGIIKELEDFLKSSPRLDYITFSGSGEPTLHSGLSTIVQFIKRNYPTYKMALLTNGTLFYLYPLIKELREIDVILPSLDAVSESMFKKINRPHSSLDINKIINGLIELRKSFSGQIWLEIFIVPGLNNSQSELTLFKDILSKINPDKVQLNTLDRPGTEDWIFPASKKQLKGISDFFVPLSVEIVANFQSRKNIVSFSKDISEEILNTIYRRPCTTQDLVQITGLHANEINKYIQYHLENGKIIIDRQKRGTFYKIKR